MIELPSAFADLVRTLPDSRTTRLSATVLPASRVPPPSRRHHQIGAREEAHTWNHHPQPTIPPPRLSRQAESRRQPVGCISRGWARPYTCTGKTLPHSFLWNPGFGGRGHERNIMGFSQTFTPDEKQRGGEGGVCCQTFSFVLFSLFSRPLWAGLVTTTV